MFPLLLESDFISKVYLPCGISENDPELYHFTNIPSPLIPYAMQGNRTHIAWSSSPRLIKVKLPQDSLACSNSFSLIRGAQLKRCWLLAKTMHSNHDCVPPSNDAGPYKTPELGSVQCKISSNSLGTFLRCLADMEEEWTCMCPECKIQLNR